MGYSTEFKGKISFDQEVSELFAEEINFFCRKRHCTEDNHNKTSDYAPSLWCDWEVAEDRKGLEWNGSEKSYDMDKWLPLLINKFLEPAGIICNGFVEAQGENVGDHWAIEVTDNEVRILECNFC